MSFNCCSGNFSPCSLGGFVRCPGSFYPSNLIYSTGLCWSSTYQLGSSLYSDCQENCCEPSSCQTTYTGCLDFDSSSRCNLGYGSRSFYSLGYGSSSFRPLDYGVCGFFSLGHGSGFFHPIFLACRTCQSFCYRPVCGFSFLLITFIVFIISRKNYTLII